MPKKVNEIDVGSGQILVMTKDDLDYTLEQLKEIFRPKVDPLIHFTVKRLVTFPIVVEEIIDVPVNTRNIYFYLLNPENANVNGMKFLVNDELPSYFPTSFNFPYKLPMAKSVSKLTFPITQPNNPSGQIMIVFSSEEDTFNNSISTSGGSSTSNFTVQNSSNVDFSKIDLDNIYTSIGSLISPAAGTVLKELILIAGNTYGINNDTTALLSKPPLYKTQSSIIPAFNVGTTAVAQSITNKDVEIMVLSGNVWINTLATATQANGFKLATGGVISIHIASTASFISDTTATVQIMVYSN